MAVQAPTLVAGLTSVFHCNLVARSLVSGQYMLDDLRLPPFDTRRRVFVERLSPDLEARRFEFLGEYKFEVMSGGQHIWEQLSQQVCPLRPHQARVVLTFFHSNPSPSKRYSRNTPLLI